ncbi:hypothetical protein U1763_02810 [Sphingomonas sp. LB2R24]|uniref:hypothetical protein n=1 Tax=Sphingomonas sorbitolis TaxID=3096165 RepID=UPI002FC6C6F9
MANKIRTPQGQDMLLMRDCIGGVPLGREQVLGIGFSNRRMVGADAPSMQAIVELADDDVWSEAASGEPEYEPRLYVPAVFSSTAAPEGEPKFRVDAAAASTDAPPVPAATAA